MDFRLLINKLLEWMDGIGGATSKMRTNSRSANPVPRSRAKSACPRAPMLAGEGRGERGELCRVGDVVGHQGGGAGGGGHFWILIHSAVLTEFKCKGSVKGARRGGGFRRSRKPPDPRRAPKQIVCSWK